MSPEKESRRFAAYVRKLLQISCCIQSYFFIPRRMLKNAKTMQRTFPLLFHSVKPRYENLIQIRNGTFYVQHPAVEEQNSTSSNLPLFRDLTFELPATTAQDGNKRRKAPHWAIIGTSGATRFLEILRGSYICLPPDARTYPYLSSDEIERKDHRLRIPSRAIQYVGFNGGKGQGLDSGIRGAYLSARYESRRE